MCLLGDAQERQLWMQMEPQVVIKQHDDLIMLQLLLSNQGVCLTIICACDHPCFCKL
jgi:hypothetical protein